MIFMKFIKTSLLIAFMTTLSFFTSVAQDTLKFDILHYSINLDLTDIAGQSLKGHCNIRFLAKENINIIYLQLKALTVDSILNSSFKKCVFTLNNSNLKVSLSTLLTKNNVDSITVYYHGKPVQDASWGGFYFSNADGGYAYNMGIGMTDYPNAYGRVWFPCVDNFTDRAEYTFDITTGKDLKAFCGGLLINVTTNSDSNRNWHYELNLPVTTDLVSVAVAKYSTVNFNHKGILKSYPVVFGVLAADSAKMKLSFINLGKAFDIFEKLFGPYLWDKVGYVVVPFGSGAMEHASNISYPKFAIDGTLDNELTMVHELSHSWWGNLVKCANSYDMWLNEGWAEYCEKIFIEQVYGKKAYQAEVLSNHRFALQYAHIIDGAVLPLSPMPQSKTYGETTYKKGADVIHTLRFIIGDSLFFPAIKKYFGCNHYTSHNSLMFRDSLAKYTGIKLEDFFNEWIFQQGQPHFSVESVKENNGYNYAVKIRQKSRFNSQIYHQVPVIITIRGKKWETFSKKFMVNNEYETFNCAAGFEAALVTLNIESELSDATTREYKIATYNGVYEFTNALMKITINAKSDSAFLLVEHHWTGPDNSLSKVKNIRFSDYRYWTFSGILPNVFEADAEISYCGTTNAIYDGNNFLDHTLNIVNEDSLVVLYRQCPDSAWDFYTDLTFYPGNKTDKKGRFVLHHFKKGDYCLGKRDIHSGIGLNDPIDDHIRLYPNPASHSISFEIDNKTEIQSISVLDISGKLLKEVKLNENHHFSINLDDLKAGSYIFILNGNENSFVRKVILGS